MEETVKSMLALIGERFDCGEQDLRTFSPLVLAYVGDAIYELVIRTVVVERGNRPVNALHRQTTSFVKAETQARMIRALLEELTEEEAQIYRRGHNAHPYTKAKNATMGEYLHATGFEALLGYLYLSGQTKRMLELVRRGTELLELEL